MPFRSPREGPAAALPTPPFALQARDLHKVYRLSRTNTYEALRGVDLHVRQGEFLAIMGPSGSGKSTLLNLLGLLDRPDRGEVRVDGRRTSGMSEAARARIRSRRIGFVFQAFNLVPRLTALENVVLPMVPLGAPRAERQTRATQALQRVGLGERLGNRPAELSGGEQQRVAVARAIVNRPAIVLADEPTGNLDTHTGAELLALLVGMHQELGVSVVVITHDPDVAAAAGRIVHLRDGLVEREEERAADGGLDEVVSSAQDAREVVVA